MSLNPGEFLVRERLRTPAGPLDVLCEPASMLSYLRSAVADWNRRVETVEVDGVPLAEHRRGLRGSLGLFEPLIVTGHQVEFFHAGVLAKVVAADALAKRLAAEALFVAVDSDTPKSLRLESVQELHGRPRRVEVLIPGLDPARAMESQPRLERSIWMDFFARVAEFIPSYESSALREFVAGWMDSNANDLEVADAMGRGHEAVQTVLGLCVPHLRLSRLCETAAYHAFLRQIIVDSERFVRVYNAAQQRYRDQHKVRSVQRPVPPLQVAGERFELPFWHLSEEGRRARVFWDRTGRRLSLAEESSGAIDHGGEILLGEPGAAWAHRIRPRALTLTLFLRMFLGDAFIHGIGGAKYDEITNEIITAFFGIAPPPMACVSATLHLLAPGDAAAMPDRRVIERAVRDIRYNPQRYLADVPPEWSARRAALIRRGEELRREDRLNRAARREVHRALRAMNEELLLRQPWRVAELSQAAERERAMEQEEQLRASREAFYGLHPLGRLRELVQAVQERL